MPQTQSTPIICATFSAALGLIVGTHAERTTHPFTIIDLRDERAAQVIEEDIPSEVDALLASTLVEFAMNPENVAVYAVGSEEHYGYIISHYTPEGEPVRFYAIPA